MINRSAFRFAGYQAVTFYSNLRLSIVKILPVLLEDLKATFDAQPISLPVPNDAPPEIPRLILSSSDEVMRMEISLARCDVRWQRKSVGHEMPMDEFIKSAEQAFATLNRAAHIFPGRLALVATRFQTNEDPGLELAKYFCRPELLLDEPPRKGPLNRPENFELHAFKRYRAGTFSLNSWFRAKTGIMMLEKKRSRVMLIEQDLNTPEEDLDAKEFAENDIKEFFSVAQGELGEILSVYFSE